MKFGRIFKGGPQELGRLPSAPKQFLNYFTEDNLPQTKLQRGLEHGMAISIGRLREDTQYDYKFVCLSHNTLRGAAGGAVLLAGTSLVPKATWTDFIRRDNNEKAHFYRCRCCDNYPVYF